MLSAPVLSPLVPISGGSSAVWLAPLAAPLVRDVYNGRPGPAELRIPPRELEAPTELQTRAAFALAQLVVGAQVLLWSLLNQRSQRATVPIEGQTFTFPAPSSVTFDWVQTNKKAQTYWCGSNALSTGPSTSVQSGTQTSNYVDAVRFYAGTVTGNCLCGLNVATITQRQGWDIIRNGVVGPGSSFRDAFVQEPLGNFYRFGDTWELKISNFRRNGVLVDTGITDPDPAFRIPAIGTIEPLEAPIPLPELPPSPVIAPPVPLSPDEVPEPEPEPLPEVLPGAVPTVAPPLTVPGTRPGTNPSPSPAWSPGPSPSPLPSPAPLPFPGTTPTNPPAPAGPGVGFQPLPGGGFQLVPLPLPSPTPVDIVDFGGQPIGGPAQQPRPTLAGVAQEVGRLERKLEIMRSDPVDGPDATDSLQLLGELWELLSGSHGPGQFELAGPCDFDENGDPMPPLVASWSGGIGPLSLLDKRLVALAELLQHHKNLRQPTCKRGAVVGEPVTVLFEEV